MLVAACTEPGTPSEVALEPKVQRGKLKEPRLVFSHTKTRGTSMTPTPYSDGRTFTTRVGKRYGSESLEASNDCICLHFNTSNLRFCTQNLFAILHGRRVASLAHVSQSVTSCEQRVFAFVCRVVVSLQLLLFNVRNQIFGSRARGFFLQLRVTFYSVNGCVAKNNTGVAKKRSKSKGKPQLVFAIYQGAIYLSHS